MKDYYLELIRQKPINYDGLIFNPISFNYICDNIGLAEFDKMLLPFLITEDCLDIDEDMEITNFFNDVIIKDRALLLSMVVSLNVFCEFKDIKLDMDNNSIILINGKFEGYDESNEKIYSDFIINSSNYDDICKIVMLINGKEKLKVEKPPKNMSAKQKDVWEKLQEGRRKEAKKNEVHIYDMLNVCEFGGSYRIPQEEIEKWTLWKIMNCYKARLNMKTYEDSLKICLVSGDSKTISGDNHWHHKLLIRE